MRICDWSSDVCSSELIGLTAPETPEISATEGVTFKPLVQTARELSENLRSNGADLIVALDHIGSGDDLQMGYADSGIDILPSGPDNLQVNYYDGQFGFIETGSQADNLMADGVHIGTAPHSDVQGLGGVRS